MVKQSSNSKVAEETAGLSLTAHMPDETRLAPQHYFLENNPPDRLIRNPFTEGIPGSHIKLYNIDPYDFELRNLDKTRDDLEDVLKNIGVGRKGNFGDKLLSYLKKKLRADYTADNSNMACMLTMNYLLWLYHLSLPENKSIKFFEKFASRIRSMICKAKKPRIDQVRIEEVPISEEMLKLIMRPESFRIPGNRAFHILQGLCTAYIFLLTGWQNKKTCSSKTQRIFAESFPSSIRDITPLCIMRRDVNFWMAGYTDNHELGNAFFYNLCKGKDAISLITHMVTKCVDKLNAISFPYKNNQFGFSELRVFLELLATIKSSSYLDPQQACRWIVLQCDYLVWM